MLNFFGFHDLAGTSDTPTSDNVSLLTIIEDQCVVVVIHVSILAQRVEAYFVSSAFSSAYESVLILAPILILTVSFSSPAPPFLKPQISGATCESLLLFLMESRLPQVEPGPKSAGLLCPL